MIKIIPFKIGRDALTGRFIAVKDAILRKSTAIVQIIQRKYSKKS